MISIICTPAGHSEKALFAKKGKQDAEQPDTIPLPLRQPCV
ncbi:hypothetical protein PAECIP111802_02971 [Paenibacillus allorhizosphaerae]|uniref:Uncharacterized protein n=1 Tax=Paenibacillus allorhizosphaerae TaxID=2849866 RepID=A0ABN7TK98_9BACL|nr:hypothetical protein PAECIP111802_02971 [Paenibacillus allorhizosphaerae]